MFKEIKMNYKKKFFMMGFILFVFLSISCVCAGENQTVSDDLSQNMILDNDKSLSEDNYNAEFRVDTTYNAKYSPYNEFNVLLFDDNGKEITGKDVKIVWNNGKEEKLYKWDDYSGYNTFIDKNVGSYKATVILKDAKFNAEPVTVNIKITKAAVKLTAKKWISTTKQHAVLKVNVKDYNGDLVDEGTVKFTVNGKSYKVKVHSGVATKKVRLNKAKIYKYTALFTGKNYNSKKTSSKVYVKKAKKYYTLKIRNPSIKRTFKVNMPYKKYVNILNAKNNNKFKEYEISTGERRPPEWGGGIYCVGLSTKNPYFADHGYSLGDYIFLSGSTYLCLKKVNLYTANF